MPLVKKWNRKRGTKQRTLILILQMKLKTKLIMRWSTPRILAFFQLICMSDSIQENGTTKFCLSFTNYLGYSWSHSGSTLYHLLPCLHRTSYHSTCNQVRIKMDEHLSRKHKNLERAIDKFLLFNHYQDILSCLIRHNFKTYKHDIYLT